MRHFKISTCKIVLSLSLSLATSFAWSQEGSSAEATEQEVDEVSLPEVDQNDSTNFAPLIFDPVLIEYVELSETDDSGANRFSTI